MDYAGALAWMKFGCRVQREGWNGKGMFIFLIAGNAWDFETDVEGVDDKETLPFICMKTATNELVPWQASQTDVLATDWITVETLEDKKLGEI